MGSHLLIDSGKCIGCGQCVQVCIRDNLAVSDGKAHEIGGPCFDCGQCEAVCPRDAIRLVRYEGREPEEYDQSEKVIEYRDMVEFLNRRRSCRLFVGERLDEDEVAKLFEAVRNTPTAMNSMGVEYVLLTDRMPDFLRHIARILEPERARFPRIDQFCSMEDPGRLGRHPLIWDATQAILAFSEVPADSVIAMGRIEMAAYTMGLGGFYSLWIQKADEVDHEALMDFFPDVPRSKRMNCVFVIGHPKTRYRRTVPRDDPKVHRY